jgi:hypothetical protein
MHTGQPPLESAEGIWRPVGRRESRVLWARHLTRCWSLRWEPWYGLQKDWQAGAAEPAIFERLLGPVRSRARGVTGSTRSGGRHRSGWALKAVAEGGGTSEVAEGPQGGGGI